VPRRPFTRTVGGGKLQSAEPMRIGNTADWIDIGPLPVLHHLRTMYDDTRKRRVFIFQRDDGSFGFYEERWDDELYDPGWVPMVSDSECRADTLDTLMREVKGRVEWLVERQNVKVIYDDSRKRRVFIFQRDDGSFGFCEERWEDNSYGAGWIPAGPHSECRVDSLETAIRELKGRVEWIVE
jgi:hypothetical protein